MGAEEEKEKEKLKQLCSMVPPEFIKATLRLNDCVVRQLTNCDEWQLVASHHVIDYYIDKYTISTRKISILCSYMTNCKRKVDYFVVYTLMYTCSCLHRMLRQQV